MNHWERVRTVVQCAYGCEIKHPEWAWFGKFPMIVCESCAAKYGIHRPALTASEPSASDLVPATPEPHTFTQLGSIAEQFSATPAKVLRAARKTRTRTRR